MPVDEVTHPVHELLFKKSDINIVLDVLITNCVKIYPQVVYCLIVHVIYLISLCYGIDEGISSTPKIFKIGLKVDFRLTPNASLRFA